MLLTRPDGGTELDLHRTLALGPFGLTVHLPDLWRHHEPLTLAEGLELRALDLETRFLHACFHASLGDLPPRLVPLRDVAEMALSGKLDIDRVISLAKSWRAQAVLARAAALSCALLQLPAAARGALGELAEVRSPKREVRMLGAYLSPGRSYVLLTVAATRAVRGPVDKFRYVMALAAPTGDFVSPRYVSRRARWGSAVRSLRPVRDGHRSPGGARM